MGLILFIISFVFVTLFSAVWTPIKLVWYILTFWKQKPLQDLNKWFYDLAIIIDVYGNAHLSILFNRILIKGNGKFRFTGHDRDTISYTLAINQKRGTLTPFGQFWANFLNRIDKDHLQKAIESKNKRYFDYCNDPNKN